MADSPSMFASFNESTMRGSFEVDSRTLKPHPQAAVLALKKGKFSKGIMCTGRDSIWGIRRDLELKFMDWMLRLQNFDLRLNLLLIAF